MTATPNPASAIPKRRLESLDLDPEPQRAAHVAGCMLSSNTRSELPDSGLMKSWSLSAENPTSVLAGQRMVAGQQHRQPVLPVGQQRQAG